MPQKIVCGGCGEVLYDGQELKLPEELIEQLNGKCPKCNKKLTFNSNEIKINILG